jgi:hypothetical protein
MRAPRKISPELVKKLTSFSYNPPKYGADFKEEDFASEYWSVHKRLESLLGELGHASQNAANSGDVDYYINMDYGDSRFIGIEMHSRSMIGERLLDNIWEYIKSLPVAYLVALSCDFDEDLELFSIVVTTDGAVGSFEVAATAQRFGFVATPQ